MVQPVYINNYRKPHTQREEMTAQVKKKIDCDIVEP